MPHKRRVVFYIVERGRIRGDDGVPAPNHQRSPKGPDDPGFGDISQLYLADYPAKSLIFGNKDQKYKSVELGKLPKKRFFLGYLSQICFPTHPPQGFCEIWENER